MVLQQQDFQLNMELFLRNIGFLVEMYKMKNISLLKNYYRIIFMFRKMDNLFLIIKHKMLIVSVNYALLKASKIL